VTARGAPVRVLHLVNGEFYAGAERVQDLLALRLGEAGYEVEFACLKPGIFARQRRSQGTPLHDVPMRSRADVALAHRLARLARERNARVLHSHTPRSALLGRLVARLARLPLVHHVHSPSERDTESRWRNVRNGLAEQWSLHGAARLVPVSGTLRDYLHQRGFPDSRIREVPNGVPVDETRRGDYAPGTPLRLGMVALFRPRKGVEVLLDAMAQLRAEGIATQLRAVGPFETAEYERAVRDRAARLGLDAVVEWTGFRSDVTACFGGLHAFVLPSLFGEGMPMVVLEAMAAGLPVVSTTVEGIPQVVRHEQDGLLTAPGDAAALAAALARIARGEVSVGALGDSASHRQRERFSDIAMARGVANIYDEILECR
jgi:glycosyltransferase involved in cell wall biosynthesis